MWITEDYTKVDGITLDRSELEVLDRAFQQQGRASRVFDAVTKTLRFIEDQGGLDHKDEPEIDDFLKDRQVKRGLVAALECAAEALVVSNEKILDIIEEGINRALPVAPQHNTAL